MPDTWITAMIHFDYKDEEGIPARAKKIGDYFGSIVIQSLKNPPGIESSTGIQCRRRPERIPCEGIIRSTLVENVPEIQWYCPVCGDEGRITEWEGTRWDRFLQTDNQFPVKFSKIKEKFERDNQHSGMEKDKEGFEVSYDKDNNKEKTITAWMGKTIKRATVIHKGGDGYLKIEFTDGIVKKYGYNELGFWEIETDRK